MIDSVDFANLTPVYSRLGKRDLPPEDPLFKAVAELATALKVLDQRTVLKSGVFDSAFDVFDGETPYLLGHLVTDMLRTQANNSDNTSRAGYWLGTAADPGPPPSVVDHIRDTLQQNGLSSLPSDEARKTADRLTKLIDQFGARTSLCVVRTTAQISSVSVYQFLIVYSDTRKFISLYLSQVPIGVIISDK
jgi:hypothetical protein